MRWPYRPAGPLGSLPVVQRPDHEIGPHGDAHAVRVESVEIYAVLVVRNGVDRAKQMKLVAVLGVLFIADRHVVVQLDGDR